MLQGTSRPKLLWLGALAVAGCTSCARAEGKQTIVLKPGQNLEAIVGHAPEGTVFRFEPGIYRQQTVRPKNRQKFRGQDGVILNGAMVLERWTRESGLWKHEGLPPPLRFHGECDDGGELCQLREDLFIDDRLYRRVDSLGDLGPGKWFYEDRRAYLTDDPTGRLVELGVTPEAFHGDAEAVVLKDLIIEKYASDAQSGAIDIRDARGWSIVDVTARWNHGVGLSFGPETRIKRGSFSHNGQLGIAGTGNGATVKGVEIAFNNYAGYNAHWEAGGTKFYQTQGLVVRDSCIHHNAGPGLWTDIDNIDVLYEGNKVFRNADDGIKHEISYDAVIRNNTVAHNGSSGFDVWLWGSQILIQNSRDVEVYGNVVEVEPQFGNGIGIIHQDRGDGEHGPWIAIDNLVHDNRIIHLGRQGQNGTVMDTDEEWFWNESNNGFVGNTYIVADEASEYWTAKDRDAVWDEIETVGLERNGQRIVQQRARTELSCHG